MTNYTNRLEEKGTSLKKEIIGGFTTFLTMAYIVFINPEILSVSGMDKNALIAVTCIASFFGTLLVGLWAKVPFAMAPGMGLNAFFTYTLVVEQNVPWETALGVVFLSGVFFMILTMAGIREKIVKAIPTFLRLAVAAGIGLFIAFIGFQNMGLIVGSSSTLVTLGKFTTASVLSLIGLFLIIILELKKIKGAILISILFTFFAGVFLNEVNLPEKIISSPPSIAPIFLKLDIFGAFKVSLISSIFSFMFVDLFDSIGTIMACSYEAKMVDKNGNIPKIGKILKADAIATIVGAMLGTSTTTTFVESASGISSGARTGLASVVTASLFILALFFAPMIASVPSFATAPALIFVGLLMFRNIAQIDFSKFAYAIPTFLTVFLMPLSYSISTGISFGFLSYILIMILKKRHREINWVLYIIGFISLLNLGV